MLDGAGGICRGFPASLTHLQDLCARSGKHATTSFSLENHPMRRIAIAVSATLLLAVASSSLLAAETLTIEQVYAQKEALAGKQVQVRGKVVKVNTGIMGRNFLHLTDGTGKPGSNDLTITTQDEAALGDSVSVTGEVVVNRDFGAGYTYPLLIEQAHVSKGK